MTYTELICGGKGVHNMYPSRVRSIEKRLNASMDRVARKLDESLDLLDCLEKNLFRNNERDNKENRRVINQIVRCINSTQKLIERELVRYYKSHFDRDLSYCVKDAIDFSETVLETLSCRYVEDSISLVYNRLLNKFKDSVVNLTREHFSTNVYLKRRTDVPCSNLEDYYSFSDPPLYNVVIKNGSIFIDKGEL